MNIYVPKGTSPTSMLAVMLYIHGGSFESYTGGATLFHGGKLSSKGGIIVVTISYRLGKFLAFTSYF